MLRSKFAAIAALTVMSACSAGVDKDPDGLDPTPENGIEPPFAVSDHFAPSGFMGDGSVNETALVADVTPSSCKARAGEGRGDCYRFTYTAGPQLWAGVYWQSPANNWGSMEGKKIAPGATEVAFYAAGGAGGEILKVTIGGVRDVMLPFSDTVKAPGEFTLTTEMTRYTVPLGDATYDKVIGGFSWVVAHPQGTDPTTAAPIVVYLDDIAWE